MRLSRFEAQLCAAGPTVVLGSAEEPVCDTSRPIQNSGIASFRSPSALGPSVSITPGPDACNSELSLRVRLYFDFNRLSGLKRAASPR